MIVKIKSVKKVENTSKRYDLQIRNTHNFFANGIVIHNSCFCIGFVPELKHPELINGNIYASSKGVNSKGLVFKNEKTIYPKWINYIPYFPFQKFLRTKLQTIKSVNQSNLYQNMLRAMVTNGFSEWLQKVADTYNAKTVHVFAEIYGKGVQDLHYGAETPTTRIFAVAVNNNFLPYAELKSLLDNQPFAEMVPVLYVGPFDADVLIRHRDGKTTIKSNGALGKKDIREGIVVTSTTEATHPRYGRKICKMVSPDYLLRKNEDATEHQ